jgi:Schlafen, AlbA_2
MKHTSIQNYLSMSIKLILILSIFNSIYNQLWHIMSTNIFLLILMFAPQIIKKYEVKIPTQFEWVLLIFVIFNLFLGKIRGIIAPIFFGIAIGLIGFMILAILYSSNQIKKNYFLIILFSFNFVIAFGFILELLKYYIKIMLNQEFSTGIYKFTMVNMTYVIIGALISAIMGLIYMKGKAGFLGKIVEKIKKLNPKIFKERDSLKEIYELIEKGESEKLEFKETLRYNIHTNEFDRKIEHSSLKTITAFLNSNGGKLIIGLKDNKEISGIENDKFENTDKFLLHLTNIIKQKIGKKHLHLIKTETFEIKGALKDINKTIVLVECKKSSSPIFLRNPQNQEEFYIRTGPATTQINGSEMIDFIGKKFGKD